MQNQKTKEFAAQSGRRNFIKSISAGLVGSSLITGTTSAEKGLDALVKEQSSGDYPQFQTGEFQDKTTNDQQVHVRSGIWHWEATSTPNGLKTTVDFCSSQTDHYEPSGTLTTHLNDSNVVISWDSSSSEGTVEEHSGSPDTGGYFGQGYGSGYSNISDILTYTHDGLQGYLPSSYEQPYSSSTLVNNIGDMPVERDSHSGNYERRFDWTGSNTSGSDASTNWTAFDIYIDSGASFNYTYSTSITTKYLGPNLFVATDWSVIDFSSTSYSDIESMSANELQGSNINVYDMDDVRQNPEGWRLSEDFVKNYPGDYLYGVPLEFKLRETRTYPDEKKDEQQIKYLQEAAPEFLERGK